MDNPELNIKQALETKGYILIPSVFNYNQVLQMKTWVDEIANWAIEPNKHLNYYEMVEDKKVLSRTENFLPFHPEFKSLIDQSKIFSYLEIALGETPFLFKEKINYKYKGTGKYNPHQDIHAHNLSPLAFQEYHLNCSIFIDDATMENGCLEVVPGYKGTVLDRNPDGSIIAEISDTLPWSSVEATAGSILIFNCWIPHKSARNMSNNPRRSIYLTFNGISKENLREAHYKDRAHKKGKTREINPDLIIE